MRRTVDRLMPATRAILFLGTQPVILARVDYRPAAPATAANSLLATRPAISSIHSRSASRHTVG